MDGSDDDRPLVPWITTQNIVQLRRAVRNKRSSLKEDYLVHLAETQLSDLVFEELFS